MKLELLNPKIIRTLSNKELISLHNRLHQLLSFKNRKYKVNLIQLHSLIVLEMKRRGLNHKSEVIGENFKMKITSTELKILAMESCINSNIPKKEKLDHLKYIKESADAYQCIGYILDGKFYKLNESGQQELKQRFITEQGTALTMRRKAASSTVGAVGSIIGTGGVGYGAYRLLKGLFSQCARSCGMFGLNTAKRQYCLVSCKVKVKQKELAEFAKAASQCNQAPNPEKCKKSVMSKIAKAKASLQQLMQKQAKMKAVMIQRGLGQKAEKADQTQPGNTKIF